MAQLPVRELRRLYVHAVYIKKSTIVNTRAHIVSIYPAPCIWEGYKTCWRKCTRLQDARDIVIFVMYGYLLYDPDSIADAVYSIASLDVTVTHDGMDPRSRTVMRGALDKNTWQALISQTAFLSGTAQLPVVQRSLHPRDSLIVGMAFNQFYFVGEVKGLQSAVCMI